MGSFSFWYDEYGVLLCPIVINNGKKFTKVLGAFDTGCSVTSLSMDIINALNLPQLKKLDKTQTVSGIKESPCYISNIVLPDGYIASNLRVHAMVNQLLPPLKTEEGIKNGLMIQGLIGMDIISRGDLIISNYGGKHRYKFIIPSQEIITYESCKELTIRVL